MQQGKLSQRKRSEEKILKRKAKESIHRSSVPFLFQFPPPSVCANGNFAAEKGKLRAQNFTISGQKKTFPPSLVLRRIADASVKELDSLRQVVQRPLTIPVSVRALLFISNH